MDYSSEVLRRFRSPQRAGTFAAESPGVVHGEAEDRSLNVWVRFHVQAPGRRIEAARFEIYGCPHAVAAADVAAEWLEGREASALASWDAHAVSRALEVPTEKLGKLLRIEDALLACWQELKRNGSVVDAERGG